jgi:hypothetical protein
MMRRQVAAGVAGVAALAAAAGAGWLGWRFLGGAPAISQAEFAARFAAPLPPPDRPLAVYHLGHSLVSREIPAMLAQLAEAGIGPGHRYAVQLGWGASMRDHWTGPAAIRGFDSENAHPAHRPAFAAVDSGEFDDIVLTEMVELRDAIRWHASGEHLALWAARARAARPAVRVWLYTTWHHLDDPAGFLERIDADQGALWEGQVLRPALARLPGQAIHVIPGGPAVAAVVRAAEAQGGLPGLRDRTDLFFREPDGRQDTIHLSAIGLYLIALVHYACLYRRSPVGLPFALARADGRPAEPPSPEAAALMQRAVWDAVRASPLTGVDPALA